MYDKINRRFCGWMRIDRFTIGVSAMSWFKSAPARPPLPSLGWVVIAFLVGPVTWGVVLVVLAVTDFGKYVLLAYLVWMYVDRKSRVGNRRRWKWLRNLHWWRLHKDYFPIRLVKTCDLSPEKNYIFALCPHGVFSFGAMTAFVTDTLDFRKIFPGLRPFLCTLEIIFRMPFLREFALGQGFSSVSRESLNEILGTREKGRAAGVVVGGAAEASLASPNRYRILLSRRRGFCRVALQNGCDIVPVYSFGESDLYYLFEAEEGSFLHKLQNLFKKVTTIFPVVFYGVGPFSIFPRRIPVTVTAESMRVSILGEVGHIAHADNLILLGSTRSELQRALDGFDVICAETGMRISAGMASEFVEMPMTQWKPKKIIHLLTVGRPISVRKVDNPTEEDIDELHGKFRNSIVCLFNEHKDKYLMNKDAELVIC